MPADLVSADLGLGRMLRATHEKRGCASIPSQMVLDKTCREDMVMKLKDCKMDWAVARHTEGEQVSMLLPGQMEEVSGGKWTDWIGIIIIPIFFDF